MPWLLKGLLFALKTKRGRELLFAGALGAVELARSDKARAAYARAWQMASDPRPRTFLHEAVRSAASRTKARVSAR